MRVNAIPVVSSNIASIGYLCGRLYVQFLNGGTYQYENVKFRDFREMCHAESAGKFFNKFIKPVYEFVKLEDNPFSS